jgi:hypothetical protein
VPTTRLTDQVLANIHGDMRKGLDLDPRNNQLMAEVLNRLDLITADGYDADAAAAAMFAFSSALSSQEVTAPPGATHQDCQAPLRMTMLPTLAVAMVGV